MCAGVRGFCMSTSGASCSTTTIPHRASHFGTSDCRCVGIGMRGEEEDKFHIKFKVGISKVRRADGTSIHLLRTLACISGATCAGQPNRVDMPQCCTSRLRGRSWRLHYICTNSSFGKPRNCAPRRRDLAPLRTFSQQSCSFSSVEVDSQAWQSPGTKGLSMLGAFSASTRLLHALPKDWAVQGDALFRQHQRCAGTGRHGAAIG
mmetsp:Transcript_28632/g.62660  ORF Transcript_28632/g.62660 Transcript_28632/m.62660 type:complete len:205 (+) Transcript_28632:835-1449(+)